MTRNKIASNRAVFELIDGSIGDASQHYTALRKSRWIRTASKGRDFLSNSVLKQATQFGKARWIAHFVHGKKSHIFTIGFCETFEYLRFPEEPTTGAQLTALLAELLPLPKVGKYRLVEELGDGCKEHDPNYAGHEADIIAALFPPIRHFVTDELVDVWPAFFSFCVSEARAGNYWHNEILLSSLETICELDPSRIPYKVLCRSIFDFDQSSFFLALYRCLEALYSYASTRELSNDLGLTVDWREVSTKIERHLKWYPREEGAIERLFSQVGMKEIDDLSKCLGVPIAPQDSLKSRVAKAVYDLRNSCVHYRPSHQSINLAEIDWNTLCTAMACAVLDVYDGAR